jgi:acyl-CoA thioester hydrolase
MAHDTISHYSDRPIPPLNPLADKQSSEHWFEYPIRVHPHHTDYAGVVWHGSYIAWMEEARIDYFRQYGMEYVDLVETGCELRVVELSTRYHRALPFGITAVMKTRVSAMKGVRMLWDYRIESVEGQELYMTAQVTLVAVDRQKGKILRQLPEAIHNIVIKLAT